VWSFSGRSTRPTGGSCGLTPFPFLFGSPDWAGERDGHGCEAGCMRFGPASAETRDAFARFAGAAARRYGPGGTYWREHPAVHEQPIRAWQIWNEPNLSSFWGPYPSAHRYGELVKAAAARIRAEDPDAEVVLAASQATGRTPAARARSGFFATSTRSRRSRRRSTASRSIRTTASRAASSR
jgi:hypothetical protein